MDAQLGWTQISRAAVQRAEAQLANESQGVMDELGLLEIHQGYADRFFPGTSVLHTRLRYVLFVAWAYEDMLHHRRTPTDVGAAIALQEKKLGIALKHNTDSWGLIGRRTLPKMPAQRPSMMYWTALGAWGLLHKHPDGSLPSRTEIHARLSGREVHSELRDDENRRLQSHASPLITLPSLPTGWPGGKAIDFLLTEEEQVFLRDLLGSVHDPAGERLSLLARLAKSKAGVSLSDKSGLLCREVRQVAGEDLTVLTRANQMASLAAIMRGLYAAMVEGLALRDGLGERVDCLRNLNVVINNHHKKALALDIKRLCSDIPVSRVRLLLEQTQNWLHNHGTAPSHRSFTPLLNWYMQQERQRKGMRARLRPDAMAQRKEWWTDKARNDEPLPAPLHYRWYVVKNLLRDLENRQ